MTALDLIECLLTATEPSRELDRRILEYVTDARFEVDTPAFTSSIDAALTLLPDGWRWNLNDGNVACICSDWDDDNAPVFWSQRPKERHVGCDQAKGTVATPAIALCIAALKARAARKHDSICR